MTMLISSGSTTATTYINGTQIASGQVTINPNGISVGAVNTMPEITPGGLENLAERLDLLSLELDIPELLEISEALAKHFYTHERLNERIEGMRNEIQNLRERSRSDHNPDYRDRYQNRLDALAYARYGAMINDPSAQRMTFKGSIV